MLTKFTALFAKLAGLLAKLPHLLIVLAAFAVIWAPKVVAMFQGTSAAALIPSIQEICVIATFVLALAKQFNPGSVPAQLSDAMLSKSLAKTASK